MIFFINKSFLLIVGLTPLFFSTVLVKTCSAFNAIGTTAKPILFTTNYNNRYFYLPSSTTAAKTNNNNIIPSATNAMSRGRGEGQRSDIKQIFQMAARASSHEKDIELTRKVILAHFSDQESKEISGKKKGRLGMKKTLVLTIFVAILSYVVASGNCGAVTSGATTACAAIWRNTATVRELALGWVKNLRWAPRQGAI